MCREKERKKNNLFILFFIILAAALRAGLSEATVLRLKCFKLHKLCHLVQKQLHTMFPGAF